MATHSSILAWRIYLFIYFFSLENLMDCIGHGVVKNQTGPSDFHFHFDMCSDAESFETGKCEYQKSEKTTYRMGEDINKSYI